MKVLSSQDEILMLAILAIGKNAYGVSIRRYVSQVTGKEWSIGAIYDPLYRLERKGFVKSLLTGSTNERGGRSKRMFQVTRNGQKALAEHKRVRDELWNGLSDLATQE